MGGFIALPSASNPYVAAADAGNQLAGALNRKATRLQQAAAQQAARDQKQREDTAAAGQREWANVSGAINKGGLLADLQQQGDRGAANQADRSITLQRQESNPAVPEDGKGTTLTTPAGTKVYMPTQVEQGKEFVPVGGLAAALQSGGAWDGKTPMTAAQSHQLMQSLNEIAKQHADEPFSIDTSGKFRDGDGNPMAVAIGHKTKKVTPLNMGGGGAQSDTQAPAPVGLGDLGGALAQPNATAPTQPPAQPDAATPAKGASKGGAFSFQLPEKEPKAPRTRVDLTNFNQPVSVNEDTSEITPMKLPPGVSRAMSPAAVEADKDRHTRMAELAANAAERKSNVSTATKNENLRINKELTDRKTKAKANLEKVIKDETATDEERLEAARAYQQDNQDAQNEYETNIRTVQGSDPGHNDWADRLNPAQIAGRGAAAKGGKAAPGAKTDPAGVRSKKPDPLGVR